MGISELNKSKKIFSAAGLLREFDILMCIIFHQEGVIVNQVSQAHLTTGSFDEQQFKESRVHLCPSPAQWFSNFFISIIKIISANYFL